MGSLRLWDRCSVLMRRRSERWGPVDLHGAVLKNAGGRFTGFADASRPLLQEEPQRDGDLNADGRRRPPLEFPQA